MKIGSSLKQIHVSWTKISLSKSVKHIVEHPNVWAKDPGLHNSLPQIPTTFSACWVKKLHAHKCAPKPWFHVLALIVSNRQLHWNSVVTNSVVNEHPVITNRCLGQIGHFTTKINPVITNPSSISTTHLTNKQILTGCDFFSSKSRFPSRLKTKEREM